MRSWRGIRCGILGVTPPIGMSLLSMMKEAFAMAAHPTSELITADPGVLGGKPVVAGTRISVQLVLEKLRDGWTIVDLLDDYLQLTREQIVAALGYAAEVLGTSALV
jgi:uncharacterized protein (DUF433 family)